VADVSDPAALAAAFDRVGRIDFLFNNAGVGLLGELRDLSPEHWRRVVDVNLLGTAYGTQLALRRMIAQGTRGHIVNTASMYGLIPGGGISAYAASKHGVVALSAGARAEGHAFGVRVSVLCPGFVDTPIHERTEYVGVDGPTLLAAVTFRQVSPQVVARAALDGAARNRFVIAVPRYVHLLWLLHRISPALYGRLAWQGMPQVRRARREPARPRAAVD
jgi:NAD(P)-dependent dehydrogenase (short-subunit alcohol dehydrogenase family)